MNENREQTFNIIKLFEYIIFEKDRKNDHIVNNITIILFLLITEILF